MDVIMIVAIGAVALFIILRQFVGSAKGEGCAACSKDCALAGKAKTITLDKKDSSCGSNR